MVGAAVVFRLRSGARFWNRSQGSDRRRSHSPGAFEESEVVRRRRVEPARSRSRAGLSRWRSRRSGWRWWPRRPWSSLYSSAPCASHRHRGSRSGSRWFRLRPRGTGRRARRIDEDHDCAAPPLSRQPPISPVAPSAESARRSKFPNSLSSGFAPAPVSFPPSVQVAPERL